MITHKYTHLTLYTNPPRTRHLACHHYCGPAKWSCLWNKMSGLHWVPGRWCQAVAKTYR